MQRLIGIHKSSTSSINYKDYNTHGQRTVFFFSIDAITLNENINVNILFYPCYNGKSTKNINFYYNQ